MVAMKEMAKHPVKSAETATQEAACKAKKAGQKVKQYPWTTTGIVVGAIGVAAAIYFWPELHRYIHLERM